MAVETKNTNSKNRNVVKKNAQQLFPLENTVLPASAGIHDANDVEYTFSSFLTFLLSRFNIIKLRNANVIMAYYAIDKNIVYKMNSSCIFFVEIETIYIR